MIEPFENFENIHIKNDFLKEMQHKMHNDKIEAYLPN
jgi:hypothetical protein